MDSEYGIELVDAHCHLELFDNPKITVADARMAGISCIITAGGSKKSSIAAIEVADGKTVFAVVGIDPSFAKADGAFVLELVDIIKSDKRIVGLGEIGLDYKIAGFDEQLQKKIFIEQLDIAKKLDFPVVIHARGAIDDVIKIIEERRIKNAMFHFFEGSEEQAVKLAHMGNFISIPPIESSRRKKIINSIELSNIVVETDSPVVGKSPIDVIKTVGWIAEIKGVEFKDAAQQITHNVKKLFSI